MVPGPSSPVQVAMADDAMTHSDTNLCTTKLDPEQTSVLAAAPAALVDTVHDELSSDVNHIPAMTLSHPHCTLAIVGIVG